VWQVEADEKCHCGGCFEVKDVVMDGSFQKNVHEWLLLRGKSTYFKFF
jgi:hypothetical protein